MEISFNPCLINGDRKKQTNKKIKKELLYGSARLDCHWEAGVGRRIVFAGFAISAGPVLAS